MSEHPAPSPAPGPPAGPSAQPAPVPGDAAAAAQREIDAALDRLEAARSESLDAQVEAAEAVHETLSTHLSGGLRQAPAAG